MILGQAICLGIITLIFCALYYARLNAVNIIQTRTEDTYALTGANVDLDYVVYDGGCKAGPFSDVKAAADLLVDLAKDCYTDVDCVKAGSRWSHIYASMGTIMLIILLATICVCIGAYKPMLRCIASCCMSCMCCVHFCTWIAVAVYRFRPQGKLCALSKAWTGFTSTDLTATD